MSVILPRASRPRAGQISLEYLIIIGLALLVIVPAVFLFLNYAKSGGDSVAHVKVNEIGLEMIKTAADSYAVGKNTWLTLEVNMPETVREIYVSPQIAGVPGNELVIVYDTQLGPTEAVFFSDILLTNATGDVANEQNIVAEGRTGFMNIKFVSHGKNISLHEVS